MATPPPDVCIVADSAIPPGCVVIRLDDLVALLAGRSATPPAPRPLGPTWEGLQAVVGMLTARLSGMSVDLGDIAGDVPPEAISAVAVSLAASLLAALVPPDRATDLLRDLGVTALGQSAGTDS